MMPDPKKEKKLPAHPLNSGKSIMTEKQREKYAKVAQETYQKEVVKRSIKWFAAEMRKKLMQCTDKPLWRGEKPEHLWGRMCGEIVELKEEMDRGGTKSAVVKECADVANFAMMIADVYEEG